MAANVEICNSESVEQANMQHALFDFDGTLSLIRCGWQDVMRECIISWLPPQRNISWFLDGALPDTDSAARTEWADEMINRTTGIQTIYQMQEVAKEVTRRGGEAKEPIVYKREYLERLWAKICHRVQGLKTGHISRAEMMVPGAYAFLCELRDRGISLYLASGTDRHNVIDEAHALQIDDFFGGHIYGAIEDYQNYSKAQVLRAIVEKHDLSGPELVVFGDGFVEIEEAKNVGAIAVGVATDEPDCEKVNTWKRQRLLDAGADVIVPNFLGHKELLAYLAN